jgi:hypothetical protein
MQSERGAHAGARVLPILNCILTAQWLTRPAPAVQAPQARSIARLHLMHAS